MTQRLATRLVLGCLVLAAVGFFWLRPHDLKQLASVASRPRWDGEHYLSIASRGYYLRPCEEWEIGRGAKVCGNPWFPGWPWWNWAVAKVSGVGIERLFLYSQYLFGLLALLFAGLWGGTLTRIRTRTTETEFLLLLLLTLCQPASFYLFTAFPYAFLATLSWMYLRVFYGGAFRGRSLALFLLGFWISLTYPSGFLLMVVPLAAAIREASGASVRRSLTAWPRQLGQVILLASPFLLGPLLVNVVFWYKFGDFLLYFHHAAQYGRLGSNPWSVIWGSFASLRWANGRPAGQVAEAASFFWYGLGTLLFWSRPSRLRPELGIFLVAGFLFFPLASASLSFYRHQLFLFPIAAWIAFSSRPTWWKWGWCAIGAACDVLYLLPTYVGGNLV